MPTSPPPPTREAFARWVQEALQRLYDLPYLQKHPLADVLAAAEPDRLQRVPHLRRELLDAIHTLAPAQGAQAQSPDWRAYRILELRYIEGLTPPEVMQQLALSRSYYFREQARMLDALTTTLWERWQQSAQAAPAAEQVGPSREQLAYAEASRLAAQATGEHVDPADVLQQLAPLVESLAHSQGKRVQVDLPAQLVPLRADRVLLRQALVTAITYALDIASEQAVQITGFNERRAAGIAIHVAGAPEAAQPGRGLEVCAQLMQALGGELQVEHTFGGLWQARLAWPTEAIHTLLVVDDNQDFANLFRRYLASHSWRVVGAADGEQARQAIAEHLPTAIILDVMMPREDGWELLMALRASEATRATPIIICSVLNEPRLAQALGADGYLTKPVNQQALLRALAPLAQAAASQGPAR